MRLSEIAAKVADDLREGADLKVSDYVPAKVVPPLVIIGTGDPYVEQGETFGSDFVVHLELFLVTGTATNSVATTALNEMIEKVIYNLGDWDIEGVSAPYMATANDGMYLTSRVNIKNKFTIGE